MRPQLIVGVVVLGICTSGCRLASDITHNLVFETCLFADEVKGKVYYRMLARSAWFEYLGKHPELVDASDFAKGFKLGYADYLEGGGDGSAHPLPPIRYWKIRYETPEGRAATVQWLKGFQVGAAAAKASGYRNLVIVPVKPGGLPPKGPPAPAAHAPLPGGIAPALPTPAPSSVDDLPVPRLLPAVPLPDDASGQTAPSSPTSSSGGTTTPPLQKQAWQAVQPETTSEDAPRILAQPAPSAANDTNANAADRATFLEQARKTAESVSFPSAPENGGKDAPALSSPQAETKTPTPDLD